MRFHHDVQFIVLLKLKFKNKFLIMFSYFLKNGITSRALQTFKNIYVFLQKKKIKGTEQIYLY